MKNVLANGPLILAGMLIALFLCSCSGRQVTNADMQGTWVPEKASQRWIIAAEDRPKCQITLRGDGTFSATVPDYLMKTSDKCSGRVMVGKGQWSLSTKVFQTEVKLNFSQVDEQRINWAATPLKIESKGNGHELYFYVGEEGGARFVFERITDGNQVQGATK
jgi:hypothetical protein